MPHNGATAMQRAVFWIAIFFAMMIPYLSTAKFVASAADTSAALGERLFTGASRFEHEGPACISCHNVAGAGALGGGILGPDLTDVYARVGEGLDSILSTLNMPLMRQVYKSRPLTAGEQQSLKMFFQETISRKPFNFTGLVVAMAIGAALTMVLLVSVTWRKRLVEVRKSLLRRSGEKDRIK
jgi:ubiquinol-cytochrome c reductase cytochrome c subunit